jgi:hypothetical protein
MPYRSFSAIAPIVMSLVALAVVLVPADEAAATQLFQLLLVGQAPIVAFFAMKWLPRDPALSLQVLGAQAFAAALALLPIVVPGS